MNFNEKINENIECALLIIGENSTWTIAERVTTVFVYHTLPPSNPRHNSFILCVFFFFPFFNQKRLNNDLRGDDRHCWSLVSSLYHASEKKRELFFCRKTEERKQKKWITLVRVHCGLRYYSSQIHATTELVIYGHRRRHRK